MKNTILPLLPLTFSFYMEPRFQVDYQTIDQTKRMMVQAPNKPIAQARAEDYLTEKYGEVFTILGIEQIPGEDLWEQIAEYVMLGNFYRHNCETESEAQELALKIENVFKRHNKRFKFWSLRFEKAVHTFPVYRIAKGSDRWKELHAEIKQDMGWYGRS